MNLLVSLYMIFVLLIFIKDKEIQYQHLKTVLLGLEENELYASPKKFEFCKGKEKIDFPSLLIGEIDVVFSSNQPEILGSWPMPPEPRTLVAS